MEEELSMPHHEAACSARFFLLLGSFPILLLLAGCPGDSKPGQDGFTSLPPSNNCVPPQNPPAGGFCVVVQDKHPDGSVSPHPKWSINGSHFKDLAGAMGTVFSFNKSEGPQGNPVYISGGRAPAEWTGQFTVDCGQGSNTGGYDLQVGIGGLLVPGQCFLNFVTGFFGLSGAAPPSVTIQASGFTFSANQGMPVMNVYTANQQFISQVAATSVSPDGTSATFPFPTNANGTALGKAHYVFNLNNQTSPGVYMDVAASGFSIGSNDTSRITPYGVAAIDVTTSGQNCMVSGSVICSPVGPRTFPAAIVTLSSKGQVIDTFGNIGNRFAAVGTPTGFSVMDLQTHLQVMQGATPSAVRGIATNPRNGIIYLTAPESNSLINVPFPPAE